MRKVYADMRDERGMCWVVEYGGASLGLEVASEFGLDSLELVVVVAGQIWEESKRPKSPRLLSSMGEKSTRARREP